MSKIDVSGGIESHLKTGKPCQLPPSFIKRDTEEVSMKEIKLTQGKVALVDDEDYEKLLKYKWYAHNNNGRFYVIGTGKIKMHRKILNPPDDMYIDHIDHNGLNNQKSNLRLCNKSQNNQNLVSKRKYKGVYYRGNRIGYQSTIGYKGEQHYLGCFKSEIDAAKAYNDAAIKYFGDFANLNIIPEGAQA